MYKCEIMTLEKLISISSIHVLQWLTLTAWFIFIDTARPSALSNMHFSSVFAVLSVIIVHTYRRSGSAWNMSIDVLLIETSLPLPFPTFPPGMTDPNLLC